MGSKADENMETGKVKHPLCLIMQLTFKKFAVGYVVSLNSTLNMDARWKWVEKFTTHTFYNLGGSLLCTCWIRDTGSSIASLKMVGFAASYVANELYQAPS